jgi:hypothetical protein
MASSKTFDVASAAASMDGIVEKQIGAISLADLFEDLELHAAGCGLCTTM